MRFIPKQFYSSALFLFLCIITTYQCTTIAHTSKHYVDKNAYGSKQWNDHGLTPGKASSI